MKAVALIPIRSGSKGIPNKNVRSLAGKPLYGWVTAAALKAAGIEEVWVSTENPIYRDAVCSRYGDLVNLHHRKPEHATDSATLESVMLDFARQVEFDILVTLQATNPFLTHRDIEIGLDAVEKHNLASLLSCAEFNRFIWNLAEKQPLNYNPCIRPNRQDFVGSHVVENGAMYITRREPLIREGYRLPKPCGIRVMPPHTVHELDTEEDWAVVEALMKHIVTGKLRGEK